MDLVKEVRNTVLEIIEKSSEETDSTEEQNGLIETEDTMERLEVVSV